MAQSESVEGGPKPAPTTHNIQKQEDVTTSSKPIMRKRGGDAQQMPLAKKASSGVNTPPQAEEDGHHSSASTEGVGKNNASDSDSEAGKNMDFRDDEVEAASSLATFFYEASHSAWERGKAPAQPSSAPAYFGRTASSSPENEDDGSDPLIHKKQRRREKNRASAQQSRQRKKCHLETLEQRVEQLEKERLNLETRMHQLATENMSLRSQLSKCGAPGAQAQTTCTTAGDSVGIGLLAQTAHALVNGEA